VIVRQPPRPASWLLERLAGRSDFDPLLGDLAEQFAQGRSGFWYWWQTVGVLGIELLRILRQHGLSFGAAVLVGCALTQLWMLGSSYAFQPLYANLPQVSAHPWTAGALLRVAGMQLNAISNSVLTFATVWLVIRVHRAHQRAVVMVIVRLLSDAVTHARFTFALVRVIVPTALQTVYTLAEGFWAIRPERFAELDRRTRYVTVLAIGQSVLVAIMYHAQLVGALPRARPEWVVLDALDIAGIGYLAHLLWRPRSAPRTRGSQEPAISRTQLQTGDGR
jgi:hypothetical protein